LPADVGAQLDGLFKARRRVGRKHAAGANYLLLRDPSEAGWLIRRPLDDDGVTAAARDRATAASMASATSSN
jgi:hypothetical protein